MSSEAKTTSELRNQLVEKAAVDEGFRTRLLSEPKAAIKEEMGLSIPDSFTIEVHEDAADTSHLVLPPGSKLSESDLRMAAGGYNTIEDMQAEMQDW